MASRVGIEPTTKGLKVPCSTAELPARSRKRTGPRRSPRRSRSVEIGGRQRQPELFCERGHVRSIVIARHVVLMEGQLQARRAAANLLPGDQSLSLEAARRVFECLTVET